MVKRFDVLSAWDFNRRSDATGLAASAASLLHPPVIPEVEDVGSSGILEPSSTEAPSSCPALSLFSLVVPELPSLAGMSLPLSDWDSFQAQPQKKFEIRNGCRVIIQNHKHTLIVQPTKSSRSITEPCKEAAVSTRAAAAAAAPPSNMGNVCKVSGLPRLGEAGQH